MSGEGMVRSFFVELVKGGYAHDLMPKTDKIRSEWPPAGAGQGQLSFAAGAAGSYGSFSAQVPSNHLFHLRTLIMANLQEAQLIAFYDGPGYSAPVFKWFAQQTFTELLGENELQGILFQSIPMASINGSQLTMRLGGLVIERGNE